MKIFQKLISFYKREQFRPTVFGLLINPYYFARKGLYKNMSELTPNLHGKLLDVGCGKKPYKEICSVDDYVGIEVDRASDHNTRADFYYDGKILPFEDETFDSVLSNQVFEHVFNPEQFLKEVNRVLKPDGLFLVSVPFIWEEHEVPYDFIDILHMG